MVRAPRVRRRQHLGFSYRFVVFILWPLMRFVVSWDMRGTDKLTEAEGGVIVAPNHTSWFDPPVVAPARSRCTGSPARRAPRSAMR
jgi:1-acyl-sn-glycerol-3-phosphate acyltransferase